MDGDNNCAGAWGGTGSCVDDRTVDCPATATAAAAGSTGVAVDTWAEWGHG